MTEQFPEKERYGLSSQVQRAAVSVPANIAEGHARKTTPPYLNHLSIASGSLAEVETHIELGLRLKYLTLDQANEAYAISSEVGRMLERLIQKLTDKVKAPRGRFSE